MAQPIAGASGTVPSLSGRSYMFSLALRVIACPVADISFPAPEVVLHALSRVAAPESRRRVTRVIARFLRIGDSFDIRRSVEADEIKH
jgi:hypothetical protein